MHAAERNRNDADPRSSCRSGLAPCRTGAMGVWLCQNAAHRLHQDIYGEIAFPLQMVCFLSQPEIDYQGGAFLMVEQRPRAQSRGEAIIPAQGEMIIFTTRHRPVLGKRGYHRLTMRHGVSRLTAGSRYTLGIIFHDAK